MTTPTLHVAEWAAAQAARDRDAFFDLAIAIIEDGLTDESDAPTIVAVCAANDYDLSLHFARRVIAVAKAWDLGTLTERRATFNSFSPVHTLIAQKGTQPGEKAPADGVPVLADGTIDTEAVYAALIADPTPITYRAVLRAVGKPHPDEKSTAVIDTPDVFTVAATMPAAALADRIADDPTFRDALIDLVVGIPAATPTASTAATATAVKATGPLNALAELKKAETILRRLGALAASDTDVADVLRANRTLLKAAIDLLDLTLDGVPF